MAEIVRRRSWGGVLPLGRHVSISGSRSIHAPSVSIAPSSFQEEQNARHHKQFKLEQALGTLPTVGSLPSALSNQGEHSMRSLAAIAIVLSLGSQAIAEPPPGTTAPDNRFAQLEAYTRIVAVAGVAEQECKGVKMN